MPKCHLRVVTDQNPSLLLHWHQMNRKVTKNAAAGRVSFFSLLLLLSKITNKWKKCAYLVYSFSQYLTLTPTSIRQIIITTIITVNGLNGTGGCGMANDLTGAKAVDAILLVRLVTDTLSICKQTQWSSVTYNMFRRHAFIFKQYCECLRQLQRIRQMVCAARHHQTTS